MRTTAFVIAGMVVAAVCSGGSAVAKDYTDGIIVINESQYGKADSSINYLQPRLENEYWNYNVFATENPGKYMGSTNCYGTYHDGKLYVIAKEARDPGSAAPGGIVTVLDGVTMKLVAQVEAIDPSGSRADGRAFVGVSASKGYVSTSNGIWVMDLADYSVTGQIAGTENPFGTDNLATANPDCALYHGQCGMMIKSGDRVFAAHQSYGLLVIDAVNDRVEKTVAMDIVQPGAGIGSVVKSADGGIWVSVTENTNGDGYNLSALVKVDAETLETEVVWLPDDVYGPATSWGTWNPDTFCASTLSNCLLWTGAELSWSANSLVYRYDIETGKTTNIIDFSDDPKGEGWKVYYPSMRVDPSDDTIYMSLFKDYVSQDYQVKAYSLDGKEGRSYQMKRGYWFPGQLLFPASENSGTEDVMADRDDVLPMVSFAEGVLNVTMPGDANEGTARVIDMTGRIVSEVKLKAGLNTMPMPLKSGVYVLVTAGGSVKFAGR